MGELARRLRATQPAADPDAVALLADPAAAARADEAGVDLRDLMPDVTLFVHLSGSPTRDVGAEGELLEPVARVEGHGAVTESWLRGVLGRFARFVVRPVIDLAA